MSGDRCLFFAIFARRRHKKSKYLLDIKLWRSSPSIPSHNMATDVTRMNIIGKTGQERRSKCTGPKHEEYENNCANDSKHSNGGSWHCSNIALKVIMLSLLKRTEAYPAFTTITKARLHSKIQIRYKGGIPSSSGNSLFATNRLRFSSAKATNRC